MFRFSLATNDVQALTRTSKSVFLRTLGLSNSVCLYRCVKEGKFLLCVLKMQIALVPIQRKIKFNVIDSFIRVSVFFLFLFCFGFLHHCHCKTTPLHLHLVLHPITFCYIRSAIVLLGFRPTHSVYSTFFAYRLSQYLTRF